MWMVNGTRLINKAGDWKSEYGNLKTVWNPINNATILTSSLHGDNFLGTVDSFNVIVDLQQRFNDAQKSWKQGVVDDEGYFKLTHLSSQKVLSAIFPDKLILVEKGMYLVLMQFNVL